jgi:murein DD-endopeptidase MepM/ murein hydrolase activator NlpD
MDWWRLWVLLGLCLASAIPATADDRPQLSLPLACEPHKTCFIQNYVDNDPGAGVRDFSCGGATYEGHTGVDFRVLSAASAVAGVSVLASADGVAKGMRDGVTDIFARENTSGDIKGHECGNGVVIDHGGGWETQYCHMKKGSVGVTSGQGVKRGQRLGDVGFSGMADFAHVHLSVRHNGKAVDPFLPDAIEGTCQKDSQRDAKSAGLWTADAAAAFPYKAGEILSAGFADAPVNLDAMEKDNTLVAALTATSPALLVYGRFINLLSGDKIHFVVKGPAGILIENVSQPLPRNKATYIAYSGKKRSDASWPAGKYDGKVEVMRDGVAVISADTQLELK